MKRASGHCCADHAAASADSRSPSSPTTTRSTRRSLVAVTTEGTTAMGRPLAAATAPQRESQWQPRGRARLRDVNSPVAQPHVRGLRRATGRGVFDVSSISEDPEEPSRFAEEVAPTGDWDAGGKHCVSSSHDRHVCAQVELHEAGADDDELYPLMGDRWDTGFPGWNLDEIRATQSDTRIIEQRDLSGTDSDGTPDEQVRSQRLARS